jgi:hypothetical protein
MPNWALLFVRLALCALVSALFIGIGQQVSPSAGGWIGFVLSIPLYGTALAKPLVELFEEGITWLSRQPMRQWEGRYHEFNGIQIRVYEDDDKLWFVAKDVLRATNVPAIPESFAATHAHGFRVLADTTLTCLDLDTVEKMLARNRQDERERFILWARREVETPWERKRAISLSAAAGGYRRSAARRCRSCDPRGNARAFSSPSRRRAGPTGSPLP